MEENSSVSYKGTFYERFAFRRLIKEEQYKTVSYLYRLKKNAYNRLPGQKCWRLWREKEVLEKYTLDVSE